jgi:hypothetical protein
MVAATTAAERGRGMSPVPPAAATCRQCQQAGAHFCLSWTQRLAVERLLPQLSRGVARPIYFSVVAPPLWVLRQTWQRHVPWEAGSLSKSGSGICGQGVHSAQPLSPSK